MSFDLIKSTDEHLCRQRIYLPRPQTFYPSEASVKYKDQYGIVRIDGSCLRRSWYRYKGELKKETTPYSEWIFALGKAVEEILIEQWKQMGIWVDNNIKFYNEQRNISGEIDVILTEPSGKLFGTEIKSFYGYNATKEIVGNSKIKGTPKPNYLLQSLIYVDQCKHLIDYWKIVCYARDSAHRVQFDISLIQDGNIQRPCIDGKIDYRFTMEDIYSRYNELKEWIEKDEPPPRDFEKEWNKEKVEQRKALGEISKSAYEKWLKNSKTNSIGDWECDYCPFSQICWSKIEI